MSNSLKSPSHLVLIIPPNNILHAMQQIYNKVKQVPYKFSFNLLWPSDYYGDICIGSSTSNDLKPDGTKPSPEPSWNFNANAQLWMFSGRIVMI